MQLKFRIKQLDCAQSSNSAKAPVLSRRQRLYS